MASDLIQAHSQKFQPPRAEQMEKVRSGSVTTLKPQCLLYSNLTLNHSGIIVALHIVVRPAKPSPEGG